MGPRQWGGRSGRALHHSREELNVLTSFRAHPLMHTTGFLLATIPVAVLMPTRPIAPVIITVYVCIGTLQHANIRWVSGRSAEPFQAQG
jgi:sterol desaturase/sphingolipid hydroxylase (fatty acid hydroxylase superfamily)